MQAISSNRISQGQHLSSKAVDYSAKPDPIIYAPEKVTYDSFMQRGTPGTRNDAGLALRVVGASGLHQMAHCSRAIIKPGQTVKRGEPIAVMGHTGYTIPAGAAGAHCHWWIKRPNGTYVYPPSIIDQPFIKLGDNTDMKEKVTKWYKKWLHRKPDSAGLKSHINRKSTELQFANGALGELWAKINGLRKLVKQREAEVRQARANRDEWKRRANNAIAELEELKAANPPTDSGGATDKQVLAEKAIDAVKQAINH